MLLLGSLSDDYWPFVASEDSAKAIWDRLRRWIEPNASWRLQDTHESLKRLKITDFRNVSRYCIVFQSRFNQYYFARGESDSTERANESAVYMFLRGLQVLEPWKQFVTDTNQSSEKSGLGSLPSIMSSACSYERRSKALRNGTPRAYTLADPSRAPL